MINMEKQSIHIRGFISSIAVLLMLITVLPLHAQTPDQKENTPILALTNVTLIAGTGETPSSSMTVVIQGNKIEKIFPTEEETLPLSAEVIDLSGRFLMPGMINTHFHLPMIGWSRDSVAVNLERMFYAGVTAIRELAGDARLSAELERARLIDDAPFPHIYWAARMAGPEFYKNRAGNNSWIGYEAGKAPWAQAVAGDSDIEKVVSLAAATGASGLKIYTNLQPEVVRLLIDEAKQQGMKTWAHATIFPAGPLETVRSGVNTLSHTCLIPFGLGPIIPSQQSEIVPLDPDNYDFQNPLLQELLNEMKDRGVIMDATARNASLGPAAKRLRCTPELQNRILQMMHKKGIPISTGTDFFLPKGEPDPTLFSEIEYLVKGNVLSPLEAIKAATFNGARAIGIEELYGSIETGKIADLVILSDNPAENISALQSVIAIVKNGRLHYRNVYDEKKKER